MSTNSLVASIDEMEKSLIEAYLNEQGYSAKKLKELPERVVKQLMREATKYARLKMDEIKASTTEIHEST